MDLLELLIKKGLLLLKSHQLPGKFGQSGASLDLLSKKARFLGLQVVKFGVGKGPPTLHVFSNTARAPC